MTTQTEALTLALEALESTDKLSYECWMRGYGDKAITAIKEALAQPEQEPTNLERHERNVQKFLGTQQPKEPEQEPVAWAENNGEGNVLWDKESCFSDDPDWLDNPMPLYTTPPQSTWVGLTDKEAHELWESTDSDDDWELMKRTEAKLKEKNT